MGNRIGITHGEMALELLRKLHAHKSMGPDGLQPGVLRELADVAAKPLSIILQQPWLSGDVSLTVPECVQKTSGCGAQGHDLVVGC